MSSLTPNPSRPRLARVKGEGGGHVFLKQCAVCGSDNAMYGIGVDLSRKRGGLWYCREHKQV